MNTVLLHRILLFVSGLCAVVIGGAILLDPIGFHAGNAIEIGADASSLSEARAPGGALLVLGALMLLGTFRASFIATATLVAAVVYLSYGGSRLLGMALDGAPGSGLVGATVIELVLGLANLLALRRSR